VDYYEALARLRNHANLLGRDPTPTSDQSFLVATWTVEHTKTPQDFQHLYRDVLMCLQAVNLALNGPVPSESIQPDPSPIDAKLCYCMSSILATGWSYHFEWSQKRIFPKDFLDAFASILVRIGIAWNFVLDGDMDDIPKDTELQFQMAQV
jgi:hypothetical protein